MALVNKATLTYTGEFEKHSSKHKVGDKTGDKGGIRTGLTIIAYVNELFAANQKAKKSDGELMAELLEEFPNRPAVQSISSYRGYYKAGKHGLNPDGKGETECYGRTVGADAPKARKDANHPNVLANRDPVSYGKSKELAKEKAAAKRTAKAAEEAKAGKAESKAPAKAAKPAAKAPAKAPAKKSK